VYNLVDWAKALETFVVGFGGVFITLVILMLGVSIFSKIVVSITNIKKKES
jgi:Na+-transporting methylmalonyl-CoA/oxaloacetate decarboxylase gamma subunit